MASEQTVRESYGIHSSVTEKGFRAGVELEIEDVQGMRKALALWNPTTDGSLRNNGKEFISAPSDRKTLVEGFKQLHASLIHSAEPEPFSERTSIHVHVNCLDNTVDETRSIILWYALFEPVFFALCHESRRNNIHCVGLDQTVLSGIYRRPLSIYTSKWSKYTALNVLPLKELGTIEFRHMEGHDNAERFEDWLTILENLWAYGKKERFRKELLNDAGVAAAFEAIFGGTKAAKYRAFVKNMTANNLMDVKLSFI